MADKFKWHGEEVRKRVEAHIQKNLTRAAIIVQRKARANVATGGPSGFKSSRGMAGLKGSITYEVSRFRARVGSNLKYARIHELGGMIRPRSANALAVPLTDEARKSRGPRYMSDLQYIPLRGRDPLLARVDENFGLDPQWVLKREVHMPARPYLRPALRQMKAQLKRELTRPMPKGAG